MKVKIVKATNIKKRALELTGNKDAFDTVIQQIKIADWNVPNDIPKTVSGSRIIGKNRVIFNLHGNKFRMIGEYYFRKKDVQLFVCFVGTHEEYDELCNPNTKPTQFTVLW